MKKFYVLIAVFAILFSTWACAPKANEPKPMVASATVDLCKGIDHCTKITVSERSDGSRSALVSGQSRPSYSVIFAEKYTAIANTTINLTGEDYLIAPSIEGCIGVTWSLAGTTQDTVVDGTYVFDCP